MRPLSIAACLALASATLVAFAQDPDAETVAVSSPAAEPALPAEPAAPAGRPEGDAARGRQLAYTCLGCHGVTGYENAYPTYRVPKLGNQSEVYLFNALMAYRTGEREHATMQAQAQSFSEADLADIAAFLASVQP